MYQRGSRFSPPAMAWVYGQGPLALRGRRTLVDLPDPLRGVGDAHRHRQAHQGDPVAAHRVVRGADADRHGHPEVADLGVVVVVVAAQPPGHPGQEGVVEGAAGQCAPRP